ncbi:hypothetical protein HDV01_000379 [Terramyces sp. JEL0728]|nr:hypothetical protein HDV01_000379 [Terramyces sp. JEL0728]
MSVNQTNIDLQSYANQPWKQGLVGFTVSLWAVALAILGVAIYNRTYPPFKSKQLPVLVAANMAMICYTLALLQELQIVDSTGGFANCPFWFLWMQLVFGCALSLLVLSYRMRRLYYIIVLAKPAEGYRFWIPMLIPYGFVVFWALLGSAVPNKFVSTGPIITSQTLDGIPGCTIQLDQIWFLYLLFLSIFVQLVYTWVLTFLVSRVRSAFNEFRENLFINSFATVLIFMWFALVTLQMSFYQWGKVLILVCGTLSTFVAGIGPLFAPMFGFIADKEKYLKQWKNGLRDQALPDALNYSVKDASTLNSSNNSKSIL